MKTCKCGAMFEKEKDMKTHLMINARDSAHKRKKEKKVKKPIRKQKGLLDK